MTSLFAHRKWRNVQLFFLITASVGLAVSAAQLERFPGDLPVAQWVQSISAPLFDEAMRGISAVGWWIPGSIITVCLGLLLFTFGRRSDAGLFVALVAVGTGLNWVIKRIVASPRPDPSLLEVREELTTYGFPSGHVLFAVVCFGGLAIIMSDIGGKYVSLRRAVQFLLMVLIVAMAMSRVYLGVHWPSDTLGSVVIGSVYLLVLAACRGRLRGNDGVIESARFPRCHPVGRRP